MPRRICKYFNINCSSLSLEIIFGSFFLGSLALVINFFLPISSAHIYTLVDHKIAMQRSLPLPQCLFTFLQLLTITFSIDNNQNSNNINNKIIQFTQPEYDGIIFETNSTTKFTISTNSNEVVNMYKTCFWLNVMHYKNVDQVVYGLFKH